MPFAPPGCRSSHAGRRVPATRDTIASMSTHAAAPGNHAREHFHPLEVIPFFRRWPRSQLRDLIYTFIWSSFFGVGFYLLGTLTDGSMQSLRAFGLYMLISNVVGYSIHALFHIGGHTGLEERARRSGLLLKSTYFSGVPLLGVMLGLWISSFVIDVGIRRIFGDAKSMMSVVTVSLVISVVMSMVFYMRERGAAADAALTRERLRVERVEREATLANLRALQAQIEPHFLFNTLANVTSLIDPDPATAKRMLDSFIRFLRASLAATRMEHTTLANESELITSFLQVLQVRMGDRLRFRIDIDPELRGFELPPMLLQPVIENSIRHGLEPKVEGGEVVFRARREGGHVVIEIADTGVGFAPTTRGGVGLSNLRDRLKLLYGEQASMQIGENTPAGTIVTVRLPA